MTPMTRFTKPALGNAGKMIPMDNSDRTEEPIRVDHDAHIAVAAWGIAVFVILAVTAWCWVN